MEKIWLQQYPPNVPVEIDPDRYSSLGDMLNQICQQYADHPAIQNFGVTLTYQQLLRYSQSFASFLQNELKLVKGDPIAIMLPNVLQYPVALFGAWLAGLVVVNINPFYTANELEGPICDANVKTIVVLEHFSGTIASIYDNTPLEHVIVTEVGDLFPWPKRWFTNWYVKHRKKTTAPAPALSTYHRFNHAIHYGHKHPLKPVVIDAHKDLASLQYTGGTTGTPKGAMLTHRNLIANIEQIGAWVSPILNRGTEIIITALPLYHVFAQTANLLTFFTLGGLNILITDPRNVPAFAKFLNKTPYTILTGVNTLFRELLACKAFTTADFSQLKFVLAGGMAVHEKVSVRWQAVTGHKLYEGYGLTEASPVVTIANPTIKEYTGSVGLPIPSTQVKVVDEKNQALPCNEVGELCVKGPQVMLAYWQNPTETERTLTPDGWLYTGDLARIDEQGYVYIVDRKKDMIVVSGFNVYPNEVENVLVSHPDIKEAGVAGVQTESYGEIVKAFIIKQNPELSKGEVIAYCRQQLTTYKIPKEIEFVDELPKTTIGKVKRNHLKP